ncbi:PH domain-containing protein [Bacillus cereus]|nr:PH domain-containing protein [Bacillus cereus]
MQNLLDQVNTILSSDEKILDVLNGSLDVFEYRHPVRPGVLVATNKRLFFYGPDLVGDAWINEYFYENLSRLKEKKNLFGVSSILFWNKNERVGIRNIQSNNIRNFIQVIQNNINKD